ncbi:MULTISPECIES: putative lipid II flippase FtsW [Microterricola]|uniref:Probable peptidoglycan glycosyltransferase FtsW n=2 Tax=Microterricola TaxID=518733 RepID=A0A1H1VZ08_9MICO|nr:MULTISPECIES: putative lipid II flippase FtsW [Microterricola]PPL18622.1 putative lipid II flippase FtsW [Microterricola pindariensis]SDS89486.1 cell division-specific peptidoglycan biosynthesis regulator FtsW [Microterricola viridarii]
MSNPPRATSRPRASEEETPRVASARISLGRRLRAEGTNFYVLLGTTLFLVGFGLMMVLSSSSVESYLEDDGFFAGFFRQAGFALIGVPLMLVVSRFPISVWKWLAPFALIGASILQALVVFTGLGVGTGGNTNWINLFGVQFQPSEMIKLALVLWIAQIVSRKEEFLDDWKTGLLPVLLTSGAAIGLVLLGNDLGTVMVMAAMLFGGLFFAGVRLRMLGALAGAGAVLFLIVAVSSQNRLSRIMMFADGSCDDPEKQLNECWQTIHGDYALANGGILGAGLGNSKAKWSWLPAAHNDYIFAIIGEELGLLGAIVVLVLFVVLAFTFVKIMNSSTDTFVRVATATAMFWIIGQAFMNIGIVLGVFPVFGVPLPLISAGGTALVTTLLAIGIVLSFARHTPEEREALGLPARQGIRRVIRTRTKTPAN